MDEREAAERVSRQAVWDSLPEDFRQAVMTAPPLPSADMALVRGWLPPIAPPAEAPALEPAA